LGDLVGLPLRVLGEVGAGVLDPLEALAAPVDGDEVGPAVAVDVEDLVGVAVGPAAVDLDIAQEVLPPGGGLVPVAAADDVESAVLVYIEDGGGDELRVGVDDVAAEGDVVAEAAGSDSQPDQEGQQQAVRAREHGRALESDVEGRGDCKPAGDGKRTELPR